MSVDPHDFRDGNHWRSINVNDLLAAVAEQIEPEDSGEPVNGDYVRAVIADALSTVIEDTIDRANDMVQCNKVDECRAKAVFLSWLAWNLDHGLMPDGVE